MIGLLVALVAGDATPDIQLVGFDDLFKLTQVAVLYEHFVFIYNFLLLIVVIEQKRINPKICAMSTSSKQRVKKKLTLAACGRMRFLIYPRK